MLQSSKKTHAAHTLTAAFADTDARAEASIPEADDYTVFVDYTPGTETTGIDLEFLMSDPAGNFAVLTEVDTSTGAVTVYPIRTIAKPGAQTVYAIELGRRNAGALRVGVQTTGAIGATPGAVDIWIQGCNSGG